MDDINNNDHFDDFLNPDDNNNENDIDKKIAKQKKLIQEETNRKISENINREFFKEEQQQQQKKDKQVGQLLITVLVFLILLIVLALIYSGMKKVMPDYLMKKGKQYYEAQQYEKAFKMYRMAADNDIENQEAIHYELMTLEKMPINYETLKTLYEISQYEDNEEASKLAEEILTKIKVKIERKIGSNYIDNVLYNDILFRWNNEHPIRYKIVNATDAPLIYVEEVKSAFKSWSKASNNNLIFNETEENPDIIVMLRPNIQNNSRRNNFEISGEFLPNIKDNRLKNVAINLKVRTNTNELYDPEQFLTLAKHEIGHAIGLAGHSSNPNDIMYYKNDNIEYCAPNKKFSDRDLNTFILLYKMIPDAINIQIDKNEYNNYLYHLAITSVPGMEFDNEIQRLISELEANSEDIVNWVDLAINFGIKKQYKRSNSILENLLPLVTEDNENTFVVLYNMAANFYKMRDYEDAAKYVKLAQKYDDKDIDLKILDAFVDLRLNNTELAGTKLVALNKQFPNNVEIALKLAYLYKTSGREQDAKDVIVQLVKNNPGAVNDARMHKYRGYLSH